MSVFGGILSLLFSVCKMQSAFLMVIARDANVWHHHFSLSRSRSCDVPANHPFWSCSWLIADRSVQSPDRATHISGAGLDCIFVSSGHVVTLWCTMGCNVAQVPLCVASVVHFLCIAAGLSLPTRPDPVRGPTLPHRVIGDPL